jgi:glycosyltransferase involved in cell wall biosynthesis
MLGHVCILMATYNGEMHLQAQLDSIAAQDHSAWSLHIGDDHSTDTTRDIVARFAQVYPDHTITLIPGPQQGSAANFMSLVARGGWPAGAWLAFCDQDDVWMPDRLTHAQSVLAQFDPDRPSIYASRTVLTDAALKPLRLSRQHAHAPGFGNALVQNILAGNTLVLNPIATDILHKTAPSSLEGAGVPHHDWWVYLLMSGIGAHIINDDKPGLYYRQHEANLLGANMGLGKAFSRLAMIWDGHYSGWIDRNLTALNWTSNLLSAENQACLARFVTWRAGRDRDLSGRGLRQTGVWRQSTAGNIMMRIAAALHRM